MSSVNYSDLIYEAISEPKWCDFCHRTEVNWRYLARGFDIPELKWRSVGDWAACDKCAEYIESGKLDELAFLISGIIALSHPKVKDMAGVDQEAFHHLYYYWLRALFREFARNRTGERVKA